TTTGKQTTYTPISIKRSKQVTKKENQSISIPKIAKPQNNTPWQTGNIVLIKEANTIVPVTIQKLSNNNKCFLSENKWYEIDQVEYIDFVTP
ncbi:MAG TPA: hypothetical protein PLK02_08140, partial [Paludibacteraceae bacterium]|nr:hypothetical protein [Paludibacteraceae bacterium]